jgi:hypothetical protein
MALQDLKDGWHSFKGWFGAIFKALNFMVNRQTLLNKSHPSVKANTFFTYFIGCIILIWLIAAVMLHFMDKEAIKAVHIFWGFSGGAIVWILVVLRCNGYHNKRPTA